MSRYYLQNQPKCNLNTSVIFFAVLIRKYTWGLSCQSSGLRLHTCNAGMWVWSPVRELRSPCLMAWPKRFFKNQINKIEKKCIIKKRKYMIFYVSQNIWYKAFHTLIPTTVLPPTIPYPLFPGILKHVPDTSAYYVPGTLKPPHLFSCF